MTGVQTCALPIFLLLLARPVPGGPVREQEGGLAVPQPAGGVGGPGRGGGRGGGGALLEDGGRHADEVALVLDRACGGRRGHLEGPVGVDQAGTPPRASSSDRVPPDRVPDGRPGLAPLHHAQDLVAEAGDVLLQLLEKEDERERERGREGEKERERESESEREPERKREPERAREKERARESERAERFREQIDSESREIQRAEGKIGRASCRERVSSPV